MEDLRFIFECGASKLICMTTLGSPCFQSSLWIRLPPRRYLCMAALTLYVVVTCACLAWPTLKREYAIRNLSARGCYVKTIDSRPAWLRDVTGDIRVVGFDEVEVVFVGMDEVVPFDDRDMRLIEALSELRHLSLDATGVSDVGMSHLSRHTKLEQLWLTNTRVSDVGLVHFQRLAGLKEISLKGTLVTDKGVAELQRVLPALKIER